MGCMRLQVQGSALENVLDGIQIIAGGSNLADTCLCEPFFSLTVCVLIHISS